MAKGGSNPMQAYHKQKRQKEVQKSKQQRIQARDEKVVQTKTVAEVQEEIRNIKRRKNLQVSEQQKLQRLEKELKLLKSAAANQPKTNQHSTEQQQQSKPLTDLDDPRKSVYYDEKLNPYGAPPPGKPKLYHQRGGGVTMDIRLAIVPGEEPPPPPPPPPPPRPGPSSAHPPDRSKTNDYQRHRSVPQHQGRKNAQPDETQKPAAPSKGSNDEPGVDKEKKELDVDKPLVVPSLPAPSKAVQRSRRGKATADIWASNEEVEYELRANQIDLEADDVGAAAPKKNTKAKKKKPPLEIYYQDRLGQVQGPFPKAQMKEWFAGGFFPPTTMVKTNRSDQWVLINELQALQPDPPKLQQEDSVDDRIAALKQNSSVEDRIAALKKQITVEDRIAALKQEAEPPQQQEEEEEPSSSIEQRIAALKAAHVSHKPEGDDDANEPGPQPLSTSDADYEEPPAYPVDEDDPAYPAEDDGAPPPYPTDQDDASSVAPYPVAEDMPAYPMEESGEVPYPVGDDEQDVPYPVDDAYPVRDGEEEDAAYPVIDSYPVVDDYPTSDGAYGVEATGEEAPVYPLPPPVAKPPKKSVKVDKEVVAFLPTHLQKNRKRKATPQPVSAKAKKTNLAPAKDTEDDYDKFMEEIEDLGDHS